MSKKVRAYIVGIVVTVGFICLLGWVGEMMRKSIENTFIGVWLIEEDRLIVFSNEYVSSKSGGNDLKYIHLINLKNGEVLAETHYSTGTFQSTDLIFKTSKRLWLTSENEWYCLDINTLEEIYDQEAFHEKILSLNSDIKTIHDLSFNGKESVFIVENNEGFEFKIDPYELEGSAGSNDGYLMLNSITQLGYQLTYPIDLTQSIEPEIVSFEIIGEEQDDVSYDIDMTLEDKLQLDQGFAKNYAVLTPNQQCLLLDGEKRRTLKILQSSTDSLDWQNVTDDSWLNGELLRPYKDRSDIPKNRYVITYNYCVFIYYHSSLDTEEDIIHLAAVSTEDSDIHWDFSFEQLEFESSHKPVQNYIYDQSLITVWINEGGLFTITSIEANSGKLNWSFSD